MADYNTVKYCRLCKKRYVVRKGEQVNNYCETCLPKMKRTDSQEDKKK